MPDAGILFDRAQPTPAGGRLAFWSGCVFLILICLPGLGELPGGVPGAMILMFAALPVWFAASYDRESPAFDRLSALAAGIIMIAAAFLILWSLLSALTAAAPMRAGRYIATLVTIYALYFLFTGTVTRTRIMVYLDVVCFTLAATCLLSFAAYYVPSLHALIFIDSDRASGFFKNPNQFGMALSTVIPVATALVLGQRRRRPARVTCVLLLMIGLIASGSKANLLISSITFTLILTAYSLIAFRGVKRVLTVTLSILATVLLISAGMMLMQFFNPRALRLIMAFLEQDSELHSIVSRNQLWQYSIDQFLSNPVLGVGAGSPIDIFYRQEFVPHSHNVLLDYLRTLGAPGIFGLLTILLTVVLISGVTILAATRARRTPPRHRILCIALAVSCFAYIMANMSSDSMGPSTSPFFWVMLFLGFAARGFLREPPFLR